MRAQSRNVLEVGSYIRIEECSEWNEISFFSFIWANSDLVSCLNNLSSVWKFDCSSCNLSIDFESSESIVCDDISTYIDVVLNNTNPSSETLSSVWNLQSWSIVKNPITFSLCFERFSVKWLRMWISEEVTSDSLNRSKSIDLLVCFLSVTSENSVFNISWEFSAEIKDTVLLFQSFQSLFVARFLEFISSVTVNMRGW